MVDGPEHEHAVELGAVDPGGRGLGAGGEDARGGTRCSSSVLEIVSAAAVRVEPGLAARARPQLDAPGGIPREPSGRGAGRGASLGSPRSRSFESGGRWYGVAALGGEEPRPNVPSRRRCPRYEPRAGCARRAPRRRRAGRRSLTRPPPGRRGGSVRSPRVVADPAWSRGGARAATRGHRPPTDCRSEATVARPVGRRRPARRARPRRPATQASRIGERRRARGSRGPRYATTRSKGLAGQVVRQ